MAAHSSGQPAKPPTQETIPLPEFTGRVAVLGGANMEKVQLLVGLALRQIRQQGLVLCLDGRRQKQTEVQFRLLLRGTQSYLSLPPSGEIPDDLERTILSTLSRGLPTHPPLLLLDAVQETPSWAHTLTFLLKAGVALVELLADASQLLFGRYDTVLLLRSDRDNAEAYSKAVGRRASAEAISTIPSSHGLLLHFSQVLPVRLPPLLYGETDTR